MKIIKTGIVPRPRFPMRVVCENCDSELEIESSDCKSGQYNSTVVECPICKQYIEIPDK